MKTKKILTMLLFVLPLCSCDTRSDLEKEIDEVNKQCGFRLNTKLEDFPPTWKKEILHKWADEDGYKAAEHFQFKETRDDGIDVYTCGTYDYLTTEFYYRDGLLAGLKTRDPQFGFSVFGRFLGTPFWPFTGGTDFESPLSILYNRGYKAEYEEREGDRLPNGLVYTWVAFTYKDKLHIAISREPNYSFNESIKEFEVFLDK